jgi:hypothetical protein
MMDVDLLEVIEGKLIDRLIADPILLCDVIWGLCKPQADEAGLDDEAFGRAMAGDAIDAATTALLEELVDFFPLRRRQVLTKALAKVRTLEEMGLAHANRVLDGPKLEEQMARALATNDPETAIATPPSTQMDADASSGDSPASSASSRDR